MIKIIAMVVVLGALAAVAQGASRAKLLQVPFTDVALDGGFWGAWLKTNREKVIPHNLDQCEKTGRLNNFAYLAGASKEPFRGHIFHDSDVFKVLEGVAYSLATHPDKELEARLEKIVGWIARCQQPDGYLNTWFIAKEPEKRWTGLQHTHELYCAGHMFEAAVAHYKATGKRTFLDVACRYADHIDRRFGPGKIHTVDGHPESELALIKLWRATGEERYLKLAQFIVDEHGQAKTHQLFGTYCQDHKPIREQDEAVGHCVRAMYYYSAVADLAAITGDQGYCDALERLWQDVVSRKMYVIGSIGVQGHGEGFAKPYILPNDNAYCETCAAIGMVLWNHRMLLLTGEARFADVLERALYNGALSGVSLDGVRYFYVNPLASRGNHHRSPWHGCSCCPTNVVRFLASVGNYFYAVSAAGDAVHVVHYVAGAAVVSLKGGKVKLAQKTSYPWEGKVQIVVEPEAAGEFAVILRIPGWCEGATAKLNGQAVETKPEKGFIAIRRTWKAGDVVELDLPMPVRRVEPDPNVETNAGLMAIQRGPVVYCLEGADHPCSVHEIAIPKDAKLEAKFEPDLLGGVVAVRGKGVQAGITEADDGSLKLGTQPVEITAVPYYAWDNRQQGAMVVWTATVPKTAKSLEGLTVAAVAKPSASHVWTADSVNALNDGILPKNSDDHSIPRFTWWDHCGTTEWVAYEWQKPKTLSKAEVYWFDDTGRGSCRVPKSWRLLWRDGEEWKPVEDASGYGVEKDRLNAVTFKPVTTKALRLEVELQPGVSGGILEWRLPK